MCNFSKVSRRQVQIHYRNFNFTLFTPLLLLSLGGFSIFRTISKPVNREWKWSVQYTVNSDSAPALLDTAKSSSIMNGADIFGYYHR